MSLFVVPVEVAFNSLSSRHWLIFKTLVDAIFLLDCCLSFRTAYFDEELQTEVAVSSMIARRYLNSWFPLDIASSIPWDVIRTTYLEGKSEQGVLVKLFNILRLLKLVRILRLGKYFAELEESFTMNPVVIALLKLLFKIFVICHIVACIWWGLSSDMDGESWIDNESMVYSSSLRTDPLQTQYIIALYWAFTTCTTLGYGDIIPLCKSLHP